MTFILLFIIISDTQDDSDLPDNTPLWEPLTSKEKEMVSFNYTVILTFLNLDMKKHHYQIWICLLKTGGEHIEIA